MKLAIPMIHQSSFVPCGIPSPEASQCREIVSSSLSTWRPVLRRIIITAKSTIISTIIGIIVIGFSVNASLDQNIMPPTTIQPMALTTKIKSGNTNDYQPHWTTMTIRWSKSITPGVTGYWIYQQTNLQHGWTLYGTSTGLTYTVSITNFAQAHYAVEAVGSDGLPSPLP
jgi:hypothetical protein